MKYSKNFDSCNVSINKNILPTTLEFPYIYYKGYSAIDMDSGEILPAYKGESGLVYIDVEYSTNILVKYFGTEAQKISLSISLTSVLLLVVSLLFLRFFRKNSVDCIDSK